MPKRVNHETRRRQLAEAAWRVIRREGLEGASVRNIAREAGMSLGSLRHYFASQNELLAFALNMVGERIRERIEHLSLGRDLRRDIETIIGQTLPLDEERATESIIWLAFLGRSMTDPALGELAASAHEQLYGLFRRLTEAMVRFGLLPPDADAELEARRLHAIVDGLALHAVSSRGAVSPETVRRVISYHLDRLMH
jgi:AcrR family transcriptional regulator